MRYGRLLIALVAAALAGFLVYQSSQIQVREQESVTVLVAARDLEARTVLGGDTLAAVAIPRYAVPPDAVARLEDAAGRVLRDPLFAGEMLSTRRIASGTEFSASQLVPADKSYAFNMPTSWFVAAPPRLEIHDRIDIIAYLRGQPLDQGKILIENVEVIDLPSQRANGRDDNVTEASFLTIGASKEDVVKLLSARDGYLLGIGLRPYAGPPRP